MLYDRKALKRNTKQLVRHGNPAVYMITMIYLLATTWVSTLLSQVIANPLEEFYYTFYEWSYTIENGGVVSQGSMDAMMQELLSLLTGPMAMIGLLLSLIVAFYSMVVNFGYYGVMLRTMRGEQGEYRDLFAWLHMAGKIILLQILKALFIYLWSLLFVFPGVIAAYRYRMAEYCLLDDPNISALESIRRSKKLMLGRKFDLFVTDLSFIGWSIVAALIVEVVASLVGFTGISLLCTIVTLIATTACNMFLMAYMQLTEAGFYLFALGQMAPPVDTSTPGGYDQSGQPRNPFGGNTDDPWNVGGGNEGWNQ